MHHDVRCRHCNRLLARADFSYLQVKCPRCKTLNEIERHERPTKEKTCGENKAHLSHHHTA
ncbi:MULTISPECIES: Com family DNA-binding transcriptional regulator [Serratia]|uniref:Com family DNA-binding transcriptional regulator n=1 Tax=Serratia TaxID=613 RepID=UPI0009498E3E|nr:Com family DNA-binding transcriptional regulator [Serratia sp. 506_PEND]